LVQPLVDHHPVSFQVAFSLPFYSHSLPLTCSLHLTILFNPDCLVCSSVAPAYSKNSSSTFAWELVGNTGPWGLNEMEMGYTYIHWKLRYTARGRNMYQNLECWGVSMVMSLQSVHSSNLMHITSNKAYVT
jgi:hypothetical protein